MRETELWRRLNRHFGNNYARHWADTVVLSDLGSRTVADALADGVACKDIWRAVWAFEGLPESER